MTGTMAVFVNEIYAFLTFPKLMNISFEPFNESHLPLMLTWLETPHVKKWWDQDIVYTLDLVKENFRDPLNGYREVNGVDKPLHAFIICIEQQPIGYLQLYNAHDFPPDKRITGMPQSLGAIDLFIGDEKCRGKHIGSQAIEKFLSLYAQDYSSIFVDPDPANIAAIKCYQRVGFKKVFAPKDTHEIWMVRDNKI